MTWAVKVENVSKQYRRGGNAYASLRSELAQLPQRIAARARDGALRGPIALHDVNLEVEEGRAYALIGSNGAGKSTLLKLIARVSPPTAGRVRVRGRVGALLEVTSGIHPELSGRENIWLYGTILGLTRREIAKRFDDVVAFAELEQAIDAQVKYYSSGMQLRLGFSIASHLEPAVFVVDEALAVGDHSFQLKCLDRMSHMVRDGRTLIFVSHSFALIREVCTEAALLEGGTIVAIGGVEEVVERYLSTVLTSARPVGHDDEPVRVVEFTAENPNGAPIATNAPLVLRLKLDVDRAAPDAVVSLGIQDGRIGNLVMMSMLSRGERVALQPGRRMLRCTIPSLPLMPGTYEVHFSITSAERALYYASGQRIGYFVVGRGPDERVADLTWSSTPAYGPVYVPFEYSEDE